MKIAKIETFFVARYLVVKITTEDGTEGIGESCYWSYPKAAEATIHGFADAIIGMNAGDIEHIWSYLWRYNSAFRGNSIGGAISAIDMALWDIKGKRLQAPVWDLLGGKVRQKVRGIAQGIGGSTPEECAVGAKKALDQGFSALKFTPMPKNWAELTYTRMIGLAVEMVEAVRETVGWDFDIGIEIHRNMFPGSSVVFAQQIEKFLPYFYEDPIAPDSVVSMGGVGDKVNIPLAVGERNNTLWEFREYCQQPGVSFLKPDIGLAGGFTHVKKIAAVAESFHIKMAPHHFLGPIGNMANTHIATATPNWDVNEFSPEVGTFKAEIVTNVSEVKDGYFIPSEAPGLGIDILEEKMAKYPYDAGNGESSRRPDGGLVLG